MITLNLNVADVPFIMKVVRGVGGVRAVVLAVCEMLVGDRLTTIQLSERYHREMGVLRERRKERRVLLCFVLAVQCALLVLTEFSQQAQKRYEKKLRKLVKKGCKC